MTPAGKSVCLVVLAGNAVGCSGALVEPVSEVRQGEAQVLVASADVTLDEAGPHPTVRPNCLARGDEAKVGFACLIRWTVPETHERVSRVWLELHVLNTSPLAFDVYPARENWSEDHATWTHRALDKPWQVAGAKGPDDRGASLGELKGTSRGDVEFVFDSAGRALVQSWLAEPSTHRGIVIASGENKDGLGVASREHPKAEYRPKLFIQFSGEGG